jgi:uncharacterized LabA/DUF88 family protein
VRERFKELDLDWRLVDLNLLATWAANAVGSPRWADEGMTLHRVRVYDAVPASGPQNDVAQWLTKNDKLHEVSVHYGKIAGGGKKRQKEVDVQLAVDAMRITSGGLCDCLILVAGDGDFAPILRAVREIGPLAAVAAFRDSYSEDLLDAADRFGYFPNDREELSRITRGQIVLT